MERGSFDEGSHLASPTQPKVVGFDITDSICSKLFSTSLKTSQAYLTAYVGIESESLSTALEYIFEPQSLQKAVLQPIIEPADP